MNVMNVMNNELIWSPGQNFGGFFLKFYTYSRNFFMKIIQIKLLMIYLSRPTYRKHTNSESYSSTRPPIENLIRRPI